MRVRMMLLSDDGEVLHIEDHRVQVGYDLVCELGQPILRYTPEGTHRIFGYTLKFEEAVELLPESLRKKVVIPA